MTCKCLVIEIFTCT